MTKTFLVQREPKKFKWKNKKPKVRIAHIWADGDTACGRMFSLKYEYFIHSSSFEGAQLCGNCVKHMARMRQAHEHRERTKAAWGSFITTQSS